MRKYSIYAKTTNRRVYCGDGTYANAREGTGTLGLGIAPPDSAIAVGQQTAYTCSENFIEFDTSIISTAEIVRQVNVSLEWRHLYGTVDPLIEMRAYAWGASVGTEDFVAGSALGNYTLLASINPTGETDNTRYTWTSEAAFLAAIVRGGMTQVLIAASRQRLGTAPAVADERAVFNGTSQGAGHGPLLEVWTETASALLVSD